jgi:hypothetical protein
MPSRKEWCHLKEALRQGWTSRQGFLPTPPSKKPSRTEAPPPRFVDHGHAPPRSCSHHHRLFENNGARPIRWTYTTTPGQGTADPQSCGRNPPPPPSGGRRSAHQAHAILTRPRRAHKPLAALLQHAGLAAVPNLVNSSSPPP